MMLRPGRKINKHKLFSLWLICASLERLVLAMESSHKQL